MGYDVTRNWRLDHAAQMGEAEAKAEADARMAEAKAEMADALMSSEMPEDLRTRARAWGVEALMECVWINAYGRGYRRAMDAH